jgi:hypothetical protein
LVVGDVGCGFWDEHESFFEAVEETFAGFDGALDAVLLVVAISVRSMFRIEGSRD